MRPHKLIFLVFAFTAVLVLQGCAALNDANGAVTPKTKSQASSLRCGTVVEVKSALASEPLTVSKRHAAGIGGGIAGLALGVPLGLGPFYGGLAGFFAGDIAAQNYLCDDGPGNQAAPDATAPPSHPKSLGTKKP